jgi:hypothetical protein
VVFPCLGDLRCRPFSLAGCWWSRYAITTAVMELHSWDHEHAHGQDLSLDIDKCFFLRAVFKTQGLSIPLPPCIDGLDFLCHLERKGMLLCLTLHYVFFYSTSLRAFEFLTTRSHAALIGRACELSPPSGSAFSNSLPDYSEKKQAPKSNSDDERTPPSKINE